jgi:hypothetical protein
MISFWKGFYHAILDYWHYYWYHNPNYFKAKHHWQAGGYGCVDYDGCRSFSRQICPTCRLACVLITGMGHCYRFLEVASECG